MPVRPSIVTGADLIERFERDEIGEEEFHHADHVRLAFEYLSEHSVLEALSRFSRALKRFAEARGKTQLYNETITFAYFFLIHQRMALTQGVNWEDFARTNADLLISKNGILKRHYQEKTLQSELARKIFLLPDKIDGASLQQVRRIGPE